MILPSLSICRDVRTPIFALLISAILAVALIATPKDVSAGSGSIIGRAFIDLNTSGAFDSGDVPLAEYDVVAANDGFFKSVVTNELGEYSLDNLPAEELTLSVSGLSGCIDLFNYNWLGEYIVGFCTDNSLPSQSVSVGQGQTVQRDLITATFEGSLNGRLWLGGAPAAAGTQLTVRVDSEPCTVGATVRGIQGAAEVSRFTIDVPPMCAGDLIEVFAGSTKVYVTSWMAFWLSEFKDWLYEGDPFTTLDLADSQFQKVFGSVSEPPGLGTLISSVVGDELCGQVQALPSGQIHFGGLAVLGDDSKPGCGQPGNDVEFCLDGRAANGGSTWNFTLERVTLDPEGSLCELPIVPDANCDGDGDSLDTLSILSFLASVTAEPACADRSDANCNGTPDTADVLGTLRFASGFQIKNPRLDC